MTLFLLARRTLLVGLAMILLVGSVGQTLADEHPVTGLDLLARTHQSQRLDLYTEQEQMRIRQLGTLHVGVFLSSYTPFEVVSDHTVLEGISADVLGIISGFSGLEVHVSQYADRGEAFAALRQGEIDAVATVPVNTGPIDGVDYTHPYLSSGLALVKSISSAEEEHTPARVTGYDELNAPWLDSENVQAVVSNTELRRFGSTLDAISSLIFGDVDNVVTDSVSAQYVLNQYFPNDARIVNLIDESVDVGFAVSAGNPVLTSILNKSIDSIAPEVLNAIVDRWGGGGVVSRGRLELPREWHRWVEDNPVVRVGVNAELAPYSYYDADNRYVGITSDVLSRLSALIGIEFEVVPFSEIRAGIGALQSGDVDILADFAATPSRREEYLFSRPYLISPYAVVSRDDEFQHYRGNLDDLVVALPRGHSLIPSLTLEYPEVTFNEEDDIWSTYQEVSHGDADLSIQPYRSAHYFLLRQQDSSLHIDGILPGKFAKLSFATMHGDNTLVDILNFALTSIRPDELSSMENRWRTNPVIRVPGWQAYRSIIVGVVLVSLLVMALFFAWNFFLRKEISKRKRVEEELSDQIEFMTAQIEGTPHPIYVRDLQGALLRCNTSYLEALGQIESKVMHRQLDDVEGLDPSVKESLLKDYDTVIETRQPMIGDRMLTLHGETITVYHWIIPLCGHTGDVRGVIGGWIDVSERYRLMNDLKEATRVAESASQYKSRFLATMSHEIRTLLNAIIGMLELARERGQKGQVDHEALKISHQASRDLLELIGHVLDFSKIEAGRLDLKPARMDPVALCESVVDIFQPLANDKGITLELEVTAIRRHDVFVDPNRLKQVISNLVSNAIKFTSSGGVRVGLSMSKAASDMTGLSIVVEDSGCGIPERDMGRIFQPYTQLSSGINGTGLGLVICKGLVESMGGQLTLESEEDVGTRVVVDLTLKAMDWPLQIPAHVDVSEPVPLAPLDVLVVDDHAANRMLLEQQLQQLNQRVTVAASGAEALRQWEADCFDLVITDCNMPEMTGYELAETIRQRESLKGGPHSRIYALTANAMVDERDRCLTSGMDGCLYKPVSMQELRDLIESVQSMQQVVCRVSQIRNVDICSVCKSLGVNPKTVMQMLEKLYFTNAEDIEALQDAIIRRDRPRQAELVHKIKGGARIIHADPVVVACETVEHCLHEQQGDDQVGQQMAELLLELSDLQEHLREHALPTSGAP